MIDAQLSKEQVLELYLNRIYLSAGVYGVETMSRHLFGRPAKQLTLAESRADRRSGARAVGALAVVQPRRRDRAQPRRARADARGRVHHRRRRSARRRAARIRIRPYPGRDRSARRLREGISCASSSAIGSAATIRPTGRCGRRSCRSCRSWRSAPWRRGCAASASRSCRRRWSRSIRAPATSSRSSAVATSGSRSSTARRAAGGSRDRRSSRCSSPRRSSTASRRCRCSTASRHIAPQGPEEWAPRNASGETPDALTLRAALLESNNRAATALQQRIGSRPVLRLASDVGLHDMPDVPSLSLGTGLVTPLELTAAFAVFPNGGSAVQPRGDRPRARRRRRHRVRQPVRHRARHLAEQTAFQMVSMLEDVIDRGTGVGGAHAGACGFRLAARPARPTSSRTPGSSASRRRSSSACGSGSISRRRSAATPTARATRCRSGATSCAAPRGARPPQAFEAPAGLQEEQLCRVSYLRPVEGCPVYTEYFKEGIEIPARLCTLHQGTVKQRSSAPSRGSSRPGQANLKGIFR